MANCSI